MNPVGVRALGACLALSASVSYRALGQTECGPATLTIEADLCAGVGEEFDALIQLTASDIGIAGGQFFLEYSASNLEVIWAAAADPPSPFVITVFADACFPGIPECTPELIQDMVPCCSRNGYIDIATGTGGQPSRADNVMARITFRVLRDDTEPIIRFRRANDAPTVLATFVVGIAPILIDAGPQSMDLRFVADFQSCFTGVDPAVAPRLGCACAFDTDNDGDVDEVDYAFMRLQYNGPGSLDCR